MLRGDDEVGGTMDLLDESRFAGIHTFVYVGLRFDWTSGVAEFNFRHEGDHEELSFTDVVVFPLPEAVPAQEQRETFERVLELLYIATGTIYYKAVAPRSVSVESVSLAPAAVRWAQHLYRDGLAEFAYRWSLEHVLEVPLKANFKESLSPRCDHADSGRPPLVGMGGGRDSLVALEVLSAAGFEPATFMVEKRGRGARPLTLSAGATRGRAFAVTRRPDEDMLRKLANNTLRIGHVPVTAINSIAGVALSVLHGLGPVVMANERSASEANTVWCGRSINHQWSKTFEAEQLLNEAVRDHAGIDHASFSLLGGMSELVISRLFAATSRYDNVVTSCNVAARRPGGGRWCNDCAKCRFVFLGLAPFMSAERLVSIQGRNLLDDSKQISGYRELVGMSGHKPFECVGELNEARVAVQLLARDPQWRDAVVVSDLSNRLPPVRQADVDKVWRVDPAPGAPVAYRQALEVWPALAKAGQGGS